jgi:hypothetical protein
MQTTFPRTHPHLESEGEVVHGQAWAVVSGLGSTL